MRCCHLLVGREEEGGGWHIPWWNMNTGRRAAGDKVTSVNSSGMGRAGGIRPVSPFLRAALCLGHEVKVEVISAIPDTGDSQRGISVRRSFFQLQEVNRLDRIDFSHRVPFLVVAVTS